MRAWIRDRYDKEGRVELADLPNPSAGPNEVVVEVEWSSLNRGDVVSVTGKPWIARSVLGWFKPKHAELGHDVAGRVLEIGSGVGGFDIGDRVALEVDHGGFSERVVAPTTNVVPLRPNVSSRDAATLPTAAVTAMQALRAVRDLQANEVVVVNGASGAVGSFAVQLAKAKGAEVVAVCSAQRMDFVRSLGADHVIDYGAEDYVARPERYDRIVDLAGSRPLDAMSRALRKGGVAVLVGSARSHPIWGPVPSFISASLRSNRNDRHFSALMMQPSPEDLAEALKMIEDGRIQAPVTEELPFDSLSEGLLRYAAGESHGKASVRFGD